MARMKIIIAMILICALAFSGCARNSGTATANTPDINPKAEAANKDTVNVTLYYCYHGENLLAGETRTIDVSVSDTVEEAVVNALIAGPSSGQDELSKLFWKDVALSSIDTNGDYLFVTLNEAFVSTQPQQDDLVLENGNASAQKMLAIYSIVNTIVEMGTYSRVLIQVDRQSGIGQRITLAEAGKSSDATSFLEPLGREETLILTPENTLKQALDAFSKKDWTRLYSFTAYTSQDGTLKPDSDAFSQTLTTPGNMLDSYSVVGSNVSGDGKRAVMMVDCTIKTREGSEVKRTNIPVMLMRESNMWKLSYTSVLNVLVNVE